MSHDLPVCKIQSLLNLENSSLWNISFINKGFIKKKLKNYILYSLVSFCQRLGAILTSHTDDANKTRPHGGHFDVKKQNMLIYNDAKFYDS